MDEESRLRTRVQELEAQLRAIKGGVPQTSSMPQPELKALIEQSRDSIENLKRSLKEEKEKNLQVQVQIEQLMQERGQELQGSQSAFLTPDASPIPNKEVAKLLSVAKIQIEKLQSSLKEKEETIQGLLLEKNQLNSQLNSTVAELENVQGQGGRDTSILEEELAHARKQASDATAQVEDLKHKLELAGKRAHKFGEARKLARNLHEELKQMRAQKEKLETELKLASRASEPLVLNRHIKLILDESNQGKIIYYLANMGGDKISVRKLANLLDIPPVLARKELNYLSDREILEIFDEGQFVRLVE